MSTLDFLQTPYSYAPIPKIVIRPMTIYITASLDPLNIEVDDGVVCMSDDV